MNFVKKCLCRIGQCLQTVVRVLRRTVCCCRRKKVGCIIPLSLEDRERYALVDAMQENDLYEFRNQWDIWPENDKDDRKLIAITIEQRIENSKAIRANKALQEEEKNVDDYFKDMVPQIRKPKKLYIRKDEESEERTTSNRLAMDPKALIATSPELGVIEDNPSNWEDGENSEEDWDPNELIKESKRAEREKRLAEHQRRKQERENRRAAKQDSAGNIAVLNLSDSRDKTKSS